MYLIVINSKEREVGCPINIRAGILKRCLNYNNTYTIFNILLLLLILHRRGLLVLVLVDKRSLYLSV